MVLVVKGRKVDGAGRARREVANERGKTRECALGSQRGGEDEDKQRDADEGRGFKTRSRLSSLAVRRWWAEVGWMRRDGQAAGAETCGGLVVGDGG
ncbi:hypothetical protein ACCO45_002392 [Purpureocillium lilacinum]|uniref:Uncharacterized protein n=1 Tax=Purpureocillium lilacinum TaxID=33203 RepID=A0ACC4EAY6_PURLI